MAVPTQNLPLPTHTNGRHKRKHCHIRNNQNNRTSILLTGINHQIISCPYVEEMNRQQKTIVKMYNQVTIKAKTISKSTTTSDYKTTYCIKNFNQKDKKPETEKKETTRSTM